MRSDETVFPRLPPRSSGDLGEWSRPRRIVSESGQVPEVPTTPRGDLPPSSPSRVVSASRAAKRRRRCQRLHKTWSSAQRPWRTRPRACAPPKSPAGASRNVAITANWPEIPSRQNVNRNPCARQPNPDHREATGSPCPSVTPDPTGLPRGSQVSSTCEGGEWTGFKGHT